MDVQGDIDDLAVGPDALSFTVFSDPPLQRGAGPESAVTMAPSNPSWVALDEGHVHGSGGLSKTAATRMAK